jgi:hypothetical protein
MPGLLPARVEITSTRKGTLIEESRTPSVMGETQSASSSKSDVPSLLEHFPVLSSTSDSASYFGSLCDRASNDDDEFADSSAASTTWRSALEGRSEAGIGEFSISRSKSLFTFAPSGLARQDTPPVRAVEQSGRYANDVRRFRHWRDLNHSLSSNSHLGTAYIGGPELRAMLEPHLRRSRGLREQIRLCDGNEELEGGTGGILASSTMATRNALSRHSRSIADSVGVPYIGLRNERPFLFDEHSYPLHQLLAQALQVEDLARLHELQLSSDDILKSLYDRPEKRQAFHATYDNFVTTFCIPLLHSLAMTKALFHTSASEDRITYRYQAFPNIRVVQPGDPALPPVCDTMLGHSLGFLNFCIPLTPSMGDNAALFVESHPGREDWHPLQTRAFGLGYVFDGARCLYFDLGGDGRCTSTTVSLNFRILMYRELQGRANRAAHEVDNGLCPPQMVEDLLSRRDSTFYDEVVVDMGRRQPSITYGSHRSDFVTKKNGHRLLPISSLLSSPPSVLCG